MYNFSIKRHMFLSASSNVRDKMFKRAQNEKAMMISPKKLIETLGIEGLCETADAYYRNMPIPNHSMAKPFSDVHEAPSFLIRLGKLLEGMCIGKGMEILDFGAGTCWLSRILAQMQCIPIAVDVSATALKMGEILFRDYPPIGGCIVPTRFLHFDGYRLPLGDSSVDRIICFDVFHHVPNRLDILGEFYRVIRPGGIVGFSEPIGSHSETPQSQSEMRNYNVLEDDIILEDLVRDIKKIGFNFSVGDLAGIFFLQKGDSILDSRSSEGLNCSIEQTADGVKVTNTGTSIWRCDPFNGLGKVQIGAHLYKNGKLINYDAYRQPLKKDILPGESFEADLNLPPGEYIIDMVSESVCWFEHGGSKTIYLHSC